MKSLTDTSLRSNSDLAEKRGFTGVECSLCALALFLVAFGVVEFGRVVVIRHALTDAAGVAAREASLPTASSASAVESKLRERLSSSLPAAGRTDSVSVTVTPRDLSAAASGDSVRVRVAVNYSDVSWIPTTTLRSLACTDVLSAETTLERE